MGFRVFASILLLAIPARAAEPVVETYRLDDAVLKATRNNGELLSAEQDITIAQQRVKEAVYLFFPDIGIAGSATRFDARRPFEINPAIGSSLLFPSADDRLYTGRAYMTMSLYEGRRHINTLRLAQTALKQARTKYEAAKLDIIYETKSRFFELILAQEAAAVAEDLASSAAGVPDAARGGWEGVEAESLAARFRAGLSDARKALELARLEFLKGLNRELDTPVRVEGRLETVPSDVDLRKALIWATELRPELQAQTYRSQMDAISVNLVLGRRTPSVVLGLDYEVTGSEFPIKQNNWDATVGVRLPFSLNFFTQHKQRIAEAEQGKIRRESLKDQVHLQVRKAHQELSYWEAEWPLREKEYLKLKALADRAARDGEPTAAGLRARAGVSEARLRYLESVTRHILARAKLERAVGRELTKRR